MKWSFKIRKLQVFRRSIQISVVAFMFLVPIVARYTNYLASRELDEALTKWEGSPQGATLATVDDCIRSLPGTEKERVGKIIRDRKGCLEKAQFIRGGPWSAQIGSVSVTDPLAASESIAASRSVHWVLVISVALPLLITIIFGRVFCSWICPVGFLLEMSDKFRGLLKFLELRPFDVQFPRSTKYILLFTGLIASFWLMSPLLGYIYPPAILGREAHDYVFAFFDRAESGQAGMGWDGLSVMSGFLLGIVIFEQTVARRWWCRVVCPGGGLYSLLGVFRLTRIRRRAASCTSCGDCVRDCPMGLAPMRDEMGIECDNCGVCLSVCGDDALHYRVTKPSDFKKVEPMVV
ncbi:MAG: 4Fe-4S binding protein [Planctomycetota bacterium]|nr:4Fe-4S binding protein [Planctomycetota bacterium]